MHESQMKPLKRMWQNRYLYLLGLPSLLLLLVFGYVPLFGHLLAFEDYRLDKGIFGSDFVGLKNFEFFFMSGDWLKITFNTIFLNFLFLVFGLGSALAVALFLNEIASKWLKKLSQSLIFLPYFVSWLVVSMMALQTLKSNGILNQLLGLCGAEPAMWYMKPDAWPAILTIIYVWKFAGYFSVIFLAAITGISPEFYESAQIDGASKVQQILRITLPLIRPVIIVLALMAMGRIFFGDFGMIYGIVGDQGMLFDTTDVIDTYTFRALRQLGNFSMSAAVVFYQSVLGVVTILASNAVVRKIDADSAMF
jgi:putative aldouronate transport system permease protein